MKTLVTVCFELHVSCIAFPASPSRLLITIAFGQQEGRQTDKRADFLPDVAKW